ncbi:MAG: DsrE family protein [Candidatus Methanofastidiosia archaeon]
MASTIVEITRPPFGHENTFAGLYVASACLSKGMDVIVILRGDGAYAGMKGQVDPQKKICLPPTEDQIEDIVDLDGRIIVDRNALVMRGIEENELIRGIETLDTQSIHDIILEAGKHIIAF